MAQEPTKDTDQPGTAFALSGGMLEWPNMQPSPGKAPLAIDLNGRHMLLPFDGDFNDDAAIHAAVEKFKKDGKHLGVFDSLEAASDYGQLLSTWKPPEQADQGLLGRAAGGVKDLVGGAYEGQPIHPRQIGAQATEAAGPIGLAVYDATHPAQGHLSDPTSGVRHLVQGMLEAGGDLPRQAQDAYARGENITGLRKSIDYLIPLIGPAIDAQLDKAVTALQKGRIMRGIGLSIGAAVNALPLGKAAEMRGEPVQQLGHTTPTAALPTVLESGGAEQGPVVSRGQPGFLGIPSGDGILTGPSSHIFSSGSGSEPTYIGERGTQIVPPNRAMPDAGMSAAVAGATPAAPAGPSVNDFADANQIPMPAGARTGSWPIRAAEKINARTSLAAHGVDQAMIAKNAEAMARVGGEIGERILPGGSTQSGVGAARVVRDTLSRLINQQKQAANAAYDRFRALEADPRYTRTVVQAPSPDGVNGGLSAQVQLPVDLRMAKAALYPIYDRLDRQWVRPLAPPKERALNALRNVLTGPDFASASEVDGNLSTLKYISRTQGGVARAAVAQVEGALQRTLATAGPDVRAALEEGRAATRHQAAVTELLQQIAGNSGEPYRLFNRLTQKRDACIDMLTRLKATSPESIPVLARGLLQEMLDKGLKEPGRFDHAAALYADWQKLGPESKAVLFPGTADDIGQFFRLANEVQKVANPSESGYMVGFEYKVGKIGALVLANPLGAVITIPLVEAGQAGIARMLWTPGVARILGKGLTMPKNPMSPSAMATGAELINAARGAGLIANVADQGQQRGAGPVGGPQQRGAGPVGAGQRVGPFTVRALETP